MTIEMPTNKHTRKLKNTLMFAFMSLSIIPLTLFALIFLLSQSQALTDQSKDRLTTLRNTQTLQIQNYFSAHNDTVRRFARSELAVSSGGRFYGFPAAFDHLGKTKADAKRIAKMRYILGSGDIKSKIITSQDDLVGSERYRLIHKRYHHHFTDILSSSDFSDILIVDLSGAVVYSTLKNAEYGSDLLSKDLENTQLTNAFLKISKLTSEASKKAIPVYFSDFNNRKAHQESWFAAPIKEHGYLHSFVLFKLSNAPLTKILKETNENGIKTFITNNNGISRLEAENGKKLIIENMSITEGGKGFTSVSSFNSVQSEKVLAAYSPITVQGKQWIISVELPEKIAYAQIVKLEKIFILTLVTALIVIGLVSHYLSNYIVAPVLGLAWMAERIAAGDLNLEISETKRKDEIGRLAISFVRMKNSIRDKLTLINEQNTTLENNLHLIQQQNDELLKTDKLKDEFLATTSQELRTPLHGMLGVTETLRTGAYGSLTSDQQLQLEIINNSGHRLAHLVDDLLDYHRAYYGNLVIHKSSVDLSSAVDLVLKLSEHLLENKQLRVVNQISEGLPLVIADEQRIEQVLYNLIGNAIKYTTDGKVLICSTILDESVQIQVIDTGNGIDEVQLEQLFKPLSKVKVDSPYYRQSAGLGLAISKKLIKLMGGELTVSSKQNIGTTFTFTLPIAVNGDHKENNVIEKSHYHPPIQYQQIKVNSNYSPASENAPLLIIADDEAINLQVLESFLQLDGYRIKTAKNGQETLALLKAEQPDLILLDAMMPGMSGYEVCKKIRIKFSHNDLPIIMLTTLNQGKDRLRGFESGANDYVSKPFNQKEISARITAQLQATKTLQLSNKNKQLTQSLDQQLMVESTLLETQLHLLKLLDNNSDAILCIKNDEKILYANQNAGKLFKHTPKQLQHFSLDELVVKRSLINNKLVNNKLVNNTLDIYIEGKITSITASVIKLPEQSGWHSLIVFCSDNNYDMQHINNLESAVEVLSAYSLDGNSNQLQTLKELGGEFTRLAEKMEGKSTDKKHIKRELVVDIMTKLLAYWEKESGKTKFQLAEDSQIWRVYLDRSTLQTRTLDKYLHIETLPKAPRWRNVLGTIDYVFKQCDVESKQRDVIEKLRLQLQRLLS